MLLHGQVVAAGQTFPGETFETAFSCLEFSSCTPTSVMLRKGLSGGSWLASHAFRGLLKIAVIEGLMINSLSSS